MQCIKSGKVMHPSKSKADAHLRHLQNIKNYQGHSYRCEFCNTWHIGRRSRDHIKKRRENKAVSLMRGYLLSTDDESDEEVWLI